MSRQQSCFMFRLLLKSQKWFSYQERTASAKATALSYWLLWDVEWPSTLHISLESAQQIGDFYAFLGVPRKFSRTSAIRCESPKAYLYYTTCENFNNYFYGYIW